MKMDDLRNQIDKIDDTLIGLYNERMELARQIGEVKLVENIQVKDSGREKNIMTRILGKVDEELQPYAKCLFNTLFDTSKAYQGASVNNNSELGNKIRKNLGAATQLFPSVGKVACQGVEGAYSSAACNKLFDVAHITYFKDFAGVFNAVEKGLCKYGVLPIENSQVGSVNAVYDLMKKNNFYIVRSIKLKVQHCLLAKQGVKLGGIKEIYSHEQAISQCSDFLSTLKGVKIVACENTAVAAKLVAESDRNDIASISSENCSQLYGLDIIKKELGNVANNFTRFILISKELEIYSQADKISVMVNLPHESGSLNKLLNRFAILGLNLTKIESRPLVGAEFEFMFYFDFNGNIKDNRVINLLVDMSNSMQGFTFLGSYYEVK